VFCPQFSSIRELPAGVQVKNLSAVLANDEANLRPLLTQDSASREQAFVALNTAFAAEGAFISIPKSLALGEPIHLVFCSFGSGNPIMSHPRNLIVCEAGSQAQIVESYIGLGDQPTLTNVVTEVVGGAGSVIDYYRLQNESSSGYLIAALEADISRDCSFTAHSVTLKGSLIRNDIHVVLDGEVSTCSTANSMSTITPKLNTPSRIRLAENCIKEFSAGLPMQCSTARFSCIKMLRKPMLGRPTKTCYSLNRQW
jgi:Fe-S cluster assembly protein SufD